MSLIEAYNRTTGDKLRQLVPEHWIGHPVLGANLAKTPRQKAADRKAATSASTQTPAAGDTSKE